MSFTLNDVVHVVHHEKYTGERLYCVTGLKQIESTEYAELKSLADGHVMFLPVCFLNMRAQDEFREEETDIDLSQELT